MTNKKNNKDKLSDLIDTSVIDELFNLDYDKKLLERIENNEPISKSEYFYFRYCLEVKLICMNHLIHKLYTDTEVNNIEKD